LYVRSLNLKPNKKSFKKSSDLDASMALIWMVEPIYSKAFSEPFGSDFRRGHIDQFKNENKGVRSILDEIVDKTPSYAHNLALQVMDDL
jgi:hypothetical protein